MALGNRQLTIGAEQFINGVSTSDNISDGGFSPNSDAMQIKSEPGVLHPIPNLVDRSTTLDAVLIASTYDPDVLGDERFFLSDEGTFFIWTGSTSVTKSATDSTNTYSPGTSDIATFNNSVYATTNNSNPTDGNVVKLDNNLTTLDDDWWVAAEGNTALVNGFRHPLLVFENNLWIGDRGSLHSLDSNDVSTENVLTFADTDDAIVALGIDSSTGKMLISSSTEANFGNTKTAINKIHVWDGFSTNPLRSVRVDDQVGAFHNVGGVTFVTYGGNVGYWNGNGITFLKKIKNTGMIYHNEITNIGNTLYVIDSDNTLVWAYGEIIPGKRVWYKALNNEVSSQILKIVDNLGDGLLGVSFSDGSGGGELRTIDINDNSTTFTGGSKTFYSNKINFPRKAIVRGVTVEAGADIADDTTLGTLSFIDDLGNTTELGIFSNNTSDDQQNERVGRFGSFNIHTYTGQIKWQFADLAGVGVRRFIIDYDFEEE